jgi:hypothetical protein
MSAAELPSARGILPFAVMCVGMFAALLDIQIVAASLQQIGGGLSAAQDDISWVQTAYLIAEIIVIPLSGWLTRVFSTRWLFAASAAGFTLASLLCAVAWNIESMIVFRALQGLLGASMIPTVFTSSFHYFDGPRRVYAAAVVGTIASLWMGRLGQGDGGSSLPRRKTTAIGSRSRAGEGAQKKSPARERTGLASWGGSSAEGEEPPATLYNNEGKEAAFPARR